MARRSRPDHCHGSRYARRDLPLSGTDSDPTGEGRIYGPLQFPQLGQQISPSPTFRIRMGCRLIQRRTTGQAVGKTLTTIAFRTPRAPPSHDIDVLQLEPRRGGHRSVIDQAWHSSGITRHLRQAGRCSARGCRLFGHSVRQEMARGNPRAQSNSCLTQRQCNRRVDCFPSFGESPMPPLVETRLS